MVIEEKSLKRALSILFLFSLALLLLTRLLYLYISDNNRFPINTIQITATYRHITHEKIQSIIEPYQLESFYTFPVHKLYSQLSAIPWSAEVVIDRIYPDIIKITLKEKAPLAIWNNMILTENGDYFKDDAVLPELSSLPHFITASQDFKTILRMYKDMSQILASTQLKIKTLEQRDNQAWVTTLNNDIQLMLGKQDTLKRITRFSRAFPILSEHPGHLIKVDLRYPEGMAAKWKAEV